jgi:cytochrome oxidase Cu insertion factor (SCO1/SenC/PrrC family)
MIRSALAAALFALSALAATAPASAEGRPLESAMITGFEPFTPPEQEILMADGTRHTLRDFQGDLVLATVWFTTCPSCQIEMPQLDQLKAKLDERGISNIRIMPISIDDVVYRESPQDSLIRIQSFYDRKRIGTLPVAVDVGGGNAAAFFGPDPVGTPTTFMIAPSGQVIAVQQGGHADWTSDESIAYLQRLAAGS